MIRFQIKFKSDVEFYHGTCEIFGSLANQLNKQIHVVKFQKNSLSYQKNNNLIFYTGSDKFRIPYDALFYLWIFLPFLYIRCNSFLTTFSSSSPTKELLEYSIQKIYLYFPNYQSIKNLLSYCSRISNCNFSIFCKVAVMKN